MRLLLDLVLALATQLALAGLALGAVALALRRLRRAGREVARKQLQRWAEAARAVGAAALGAALVAMAVVAARAWLDPREEALAPWSFPLAGAAGAGGAWLLLHAGRQEARGRAASALREARLGGTLLLAGAGLVLVRAWGDLLYRPLLRAAVARDVPWAGLALLAGMMALVGAAFAGVLGGLGGKPRPSGQVAAVLYAVGIAALLAAVRIAAAGGS